MTAVNVLDMNQILVSDSLLETVNTSRMPCPMRNNSAAEHAVEPDLANPSLDRPPNSVVKQCSANFVKDTENATKCLEWINSALVRIKQQEQLDAKYAELPVTAGPPFPLNLSI